MNLFIRRKRYRNSLLLLIIVPANYSVEDGERPLHVFIEPKGAVDTGSVPCKSSDACNDSGIVLPFKRTHSWSVEKAEFLPVYLEEGQFEVRVKNNAGHSGKVRLNYLGLAAYSLDPRKTPTTLCSQIDDVQRCEAEDASGVIDSVKSCSECSGGKFVDFKASGSYLVWTVDVPTGGEEAAGDPVDREGRE